MLMVMASFRERCKCIYLPDNSTWNGTWSFSQNETDLSSDIMIGIRALDDRWYFSAPRGWKWRIMSTSETLNGEIEYTGEDRSHLMLVQGGFSFLFIISEYVKENTRFTKYCLSRGQIVEIGRNERNTICLNDQSVSDKQATLVVGRNGEATFSDRSTNGSFINGKKIHKNSHTCKFGDSIFIPPNLRMIYLSEVLAVSNASILTSVRLAELKETETHTEVQTEIIENSVVDYQRAPRILEKADNDPVEIEAPIAKADNREIPLILTIGPSMTMVFPMMVSTFVAQMNSANSSNFMVSGIAMMGTSALLATMWGLINGRYRKKTEYITEGRRTRLYRNYIKEKEYMLEALNKKEYKRLSNMYVTSEECLKMVSGLSERLWERLPAHEDFLDVRVGIGDVDLPNPLNIPAAKLSLTDDPLRSEPDRLKNKYGKVNDAPIRVSLRNEKLLGLLGRTSAAASAFSIIIHTAAMHSYHNVKIVVLTDEQHYSQWQWTRWLPHAFADDNHSLRMVAASPNAISEVLLHLDELLAMRLNTEDEDSQSTDDNKALKKQPLPHYIVFCTNQNLLKSEPVLKRIIASKPIGISLVCLSSSLNELPKECGVVINCRKRNSGIYYVDGDVTPAKMDYTSLSLANRFAKSIAAIRSYDSDGSAAVPMVVKFLSMYGVKKAEELEIWRWWNENHTYDGVRAHIGMRAGGALFTLDISDRHHGPHGLIAGTTGSGKSVMLQSYILSLALHYSPKEIQFVLIDYKGGGMANAFKGMPHVAGSIDNLQGLRVIRRALASIQGEIRRRETVFKNAGVSNIDEYIRYYNDEAGYDPLGHLIIIVDEFAELKKEQPEFMRELISASRVGRSVGVHLILATQKPSNSVDDEIWSNARFHICLRVQTRADSMDMLKRPDAAYIHGMGRCYVQVGNDELFETVQTSWSSAPYEPEKMDVDNKPYLLNDVGQPIILHEKKVQGKEKQETQIEAVLKHLCAVALEHGISNAKTLWLDELSRTVDLDTIATNNKKCFDGEQWPSLEDDQISAVVGLADDLQNQQYIPVEIDLTSHKNHLIVGLGGTGKTTFVQTLAMALAMKYSPAALNMYFITSSSRAMNNLKELPHTGEMLFDEEVDEIVRLLHMLHDESNKRGKMFAQVATDNFLIYNRMVQDTDKVPAIVVFVDRFGQLDEMLNDEDKQIFYSLIKDASSRGVFFVATAISINEVYSRIRSNFFNIALQLHERAEYTDVLGRRMPSEMNDILPYPGRGLIAIDENLYEIQIALCGGLENDTERSAFVTEIAQSMQKKWTGLKPKHIARIPNKPLLSELIKAAQIMGMDKELQLPIAYQKLAGIPYLADLNRQYAWLIAGSRQSGKTTFLRGIVRQFTQRNADIKVFGDSLWKSYAQECKAVYYDPTDKVTVDEFAVELHQEITQRKMLRRQQASDEQRLMLARQFKPYVIVIDDLALMLNKISPELERILSLCCSSASEFGIYLFASVGTKTLPQIRSRDLLQSLCATQNGLSLCGKLSDNDLWDIQANYATKGKIMPVGQGYMVCGNKVRHVILPMYDNKEVL